MLRSQRSCVANSSMPASTAKARSLARTARRSAHPSSTNSLIRSTNSSTLALPPRLSLSLPLPPTEKRTSFSVVASASASPDSAAFAPPIRRRVIILPGLGNSDADYGKLASLLRSRGAAVKVARVARIDWARNAAGLLLPEYWKGTLEPRPTVDWYLGRIDEALEALNNEISRASSPTSSAGNDSNNSSSDSSPPPLPPLTLLAHSAGGWLGRVWMLSEDERTGEEKAALVSDFVSVGSPHRPPPLGSSIPDQTRGILTWVEKFTPGAFHFEKHGVRYTTIASRFVKGAPLFGSGSISTLEEDEREEEEMRANSNGASSSSSMSFDSDDSDISFLNLAPLQGSSSNSNGKRNKISLAQRLAGFGYEAVCGDPEAWGDGITPVPSSHLPGAVTLTLEGVFHSPLGADEGGSGSEEGSDEGGNNNNDGIGRRPWYGSEGVLDQWVGVVFGEAPVETVDVSL